MQILSIKLMKFARCFLSVFLLYLYCSVILDALSKLEKLILKLLSATSDKNFQFSDLILLLKKFEFEERSTGGSHRFFIKMGLKKLLIFSIMVIKPNHTKLNRLGIFL